MADASVRLTLDASRVAAGARQAAGGFADVAKSATRMAARATDAGQAADQAAGKTRMIGRGFTARNVSAADDLVSRLRRIGRAAGQTQGQIGRIAAEASRAMPMAARATELLTMRQASGSKVARSYLDAVRRMDFDFYQRTVNQAARSTDNLGESQQRTRMQFARGGGFTAGTDQVREAGRATRQTAEYMRRLARDARAAGAAVGGIPPVRPPPRGAGGRFVGRDGRDFQRAVAGDYLDRRSTHMAGALAGLSGDARQVQRVLEDAADAVRSSTDEQANAMARLATLVPDEADQAKVMAAAMRTALGQSEAGRVAPTTIAETIATVYTGVSGTLGLDAAIAAADFGGALGKATGATPEKATQSLIAAYNALGDTSLVGERAAGEVKRMADLMARTQQLFAFEDLGQVSRGLARGGGAAAAFGVSDRDLFQYLGYLNTGGITGAQAGTAFKSMAVNMAQASERLGFTIERDKETGGIDLFRTLRNVAEGGFSGDELKRGFGSYAFSGVSLALRNLEAFDKDALTLSQSIGTVMDAAAKQAETLTARSERLATAQDALRGRLAEGSNAARAAGLSIAEAGVRTVVWAMDLPVLGKALTNVAGATLQAAAGASGFVVGALELSTGILSTVTLLGQMRRMLGGGGAGLFARMLSGFKAVAGFAVLALKPVIGGFAILFKSIMAGITRATVASAGIGRGAGGAAGTAGKAATAATLVAAASVAVGTIVVGQMILDKLVPKFGEAGAEAGTATANFFRRLLGLEEKDAPEFKENTDSFIRRLLWPSMPEIVEKPAATDAASATVSAAPPVTVAAAPVVAPAAETAAQTVATAESPGLMTAGAAIPETMAAGVDEGKPTLIQAVGNAFRALVPWMAKSDAEVGPLSHLTAYGAAIPETMAAGVMAGAPALTAALMSAFRPLIGAFPQIAVPQVEAEAPAPAVTVATPQVAVPPAAVAPAPALSQPAVNVAVPAAESAAPGLLTGITTALARLLAPILAPVLPREPSAAAETAEPATAVVAPLSAGLPEPKQVAGGLGMAAAAAPAALSDALAPPPAVLPPGTLPSPATGPGATAGVDIALLAEALAANTRALERLARAVENQQDDNKRQHRRKQQSPDPAGLDNAFVLSGLEAAL